MLKLNIKPLSIKKKKNTESLPRIIYQITHRVMARIEPSVYREGRKMIYRRSRYIHRYNDTNRDG